MTQRASTARARPAKHRQSAASVNFVRLLASSATKLESPYASGGAQMGRQFTAGELAMASSRAAAMEEAASGGSWIAGIRRSLYYEAGSKTWATRVFQEQFAGIDSAVVKGILTVQRYGWVRGLRPEFTTAYWQTIRTGLTPLAGNPWVVIPAGAVVAGTSYWVVSRSGLPDRIGQWLSGTNETGSGR